jgi:hypothetical protein
MRRSLVIFSILFVAAAVSARAQVVYSATARQTSLTVGVMASVFQPDFAGDWGPPPNYPFPVAESSTYPLIGAGAYVDMKYNRWIQIEGEARWLRFNRYEGIHQDDYLIGPRVPIRRIWKANVYGKALVGFSKMDLGGGYHGTFTNIAFGGGADMHLTRKISFRVIDVEYQYWPTWGNSTLSPYGASMGISYRIF